MLIICLEVRNHWFFWPSKSRIYSIVCYCYYSNVRAATGQCACGFGVKSRVGYVIEYSPATLLTFGYATEIGLDEPRYISISGPLIFRQLGRHQVAVVMIWRRVIANLRFSRASEIAIRRAEAGGQLSWNSNW